MYLTCDVEKKYFVCPHESTVTPALCVSAWY